MFDELDLTESIDLMNSNGLNDIQCYFSLMECEVVNCLNFDSFANEKISDLNEQKWSELVFGEFECEDMNCFEF